MEDIVARIGRGLEEAGGILAEYEPGEVSFRFKQGDDPVTEADQRVDARLKEILPGPGEGWLSEETADSADRLARGDVWIVDPLDGTREFVSGIPEWCVAIGFVRDGQAVAGGILNPATGETIIGAVDRGVTLNTAPASASRRAELSGARIAASRSEVKRGEWESVVDAPFTVVPCGSVAYKLGLVAAGVYDATWTLVPKHEWDIAAGIALVLAGGGRVFSPSGGPIRLNRQNPRVTGLVATGPNLAGGVAAYLGIALSDV